MTVDRRNLEGCVAMVTGASRGIGRSIALEFAAAGADLVLHTGTNRDAAECVAAEVETLGRKAAVLVADIADAAIHASLVDDAWNAFSRLNIWVNNAGADVLTGAASVWSFDAKLDYLWKVDVRGTISLSRMAGMRMKAERAGGAADSDACILNMGWDQAETGMAGDSGEMFGAIKGAIMAHSRSLAMSLAPEVRVNCLAPGWIKTAWGHGAADYWQRRAETESLLGRWGQPEDVAAVARFLVSPDARFVTGQIVHVNGGFRRHVP